MDGHVDGVKIDAIDAMPKDAGPRVAEARNLEAGDERRAVGLRDFFSQLYSNLYKELVSNSEWHSARTKG